MFISSENYEDMIGLKNFIEAGTVGANREFEWRGTDEHAVDVACEVGAERVAAPCHFNDDGDLVAATGVRPFPVGKTFAPTRWGGDFGEYASFACTPVPTFGEARWELPDHRFVYWRGRVTALELLT